MYMAYLATSTYPHPPAFNRRPATNLILVQNTIVPVRTPEPEIQPRKGPLSVSSSNDNGKKRITVIPSEKSERRGILNLEKFKEIVERERKEEVNRKIASKKAISVILRREATKAVIDKKRGPINSKKLLPRTVLEALHERATALRWESALKVTLLFKFDIVQFYLFIYLFFYGFELLRDQMWYRPNVGVYIKLIVMLGKCKQPKKAHELFQAMIDEDCEVNHQAYTALVSAYGNQTQHSYIQHLLIPTGKQKWCFWQLVGVNVGLLPERSNSLFPLLKRFAEMESTLVKMLGEDCEPDVWTMNSTIRAFGNSGQIETMEKCYEKFQRAGIEPSISTFNILLDCYGKAGNYEK
ncbi:hypothetical protein LWI29_026582 [Acer saccharum]|uniref:Pentatricopeptide repeat-containing protein n=1 Tax=Acer saccharum TaxID=4024 RepID=A0AA39S536_ACESA|nr:hypothetical protein LWI29_026582 [Acer saccharum]